MKKTKFLDRRRLMKNTTSAMSILIAAILVFSSAVSATYIDNTPEKENVNINAKSTPMSGNMCTLISQNSEDVYIEQQPVPRGWGPRGALTIYDNGMDYSGLGASQWDESFAFDPVSADDFILTDPGNVTIDYVYWRGGYWNGDPAPFDWNVTIYDDDGTGLAPGTEIVHYVFANADTHETLIELSGTSYFFDYWVELPTPLTVTVDTKYWISCQGVGLYPPQSGFAIHETILNAEGVLKSVYFGFPDWTPWSVVSPPAKDFCFQLKKYVDTQHDVGVNSINTLETGPAAESFPVEVTVENFANAETDVPIQMIIGKITGITVYTAYEEDFEADDGGYTVTGGLWEWGAPDPLWTGPPAAHSGSKCWGTDLDYDYVNNADAMLDSVPITVPIGATLYFWQWVDTETNWDYCYVEISEDGGPFTTIATFTGLYAYWDEFEYSLSDYVGSDIIIRWHFTSDSSVDWYPGWYIDDVTITYEDYGLEEEYNEIVLVDLAVGQVLDVTFPDWEPEDWQVAENVDIDYVAEATALLPGDEIPDNDQQAIVFTLSYPFLHDIELTSINAPPLRGTPAQTLPVEVTIKNVGQFEECCYRTNVQIGQPGYVVTGWFSTFEADNGGFTAAGDGTWEWGEPTSGPGSAYSGSKVWATQLGGDYWNNADGRLESGVITVPTGADLTYAHWYNIEGNYDGYNVKISTDYGSTWNILGSYLDPYTYASCYAVAISGETCFAGSQLSWTEVTFDLSAYEGMDVMLRWHFGSDSSVPYPGAYIDDVLVGEVEISVIAEYDEDICTIVLDPGESADLTFPDWTPDDLSNYGLQDTSIEYTVIAIAEDPDDTNPANDEIVESLTLDYFHDVKVEDITSPSEGRSAPGDILWNWDATVAHGDDQMLGIEWDGTYFYLTGAGGTTVPDPNYVYRYEFDGTYVDRVAQTSAVGWGWRDIAYDGTHMYSSDSLDIVEWSITGPAGSPVLNIHNTHVGVSPVSPARALAYDPATDHFWTASFSSNFFEFDLTGTVYNSFINPWAGAYGMAWDDLSDDGPWLWVHDQGASQCIIQQVDPATGTGTGVTYTYTQGVAGGACMVDKDGLGQFVGVTQGTPDEAFGIEICETGPPGAPTPDMFILPGTQSIEALVENAGVFIETGMNVNAEIYEYITNTTVGTLVYDEDYTTGTLDPLGGQETATFPGYTFPDIAGVYLLIFTITLANDDYPDNNIMDLGIGVDNEAPNSQHTIDPATPDGLNGWYVSDVTVSFTADDGTEVWQSGVDHIEYKVNGGSVQTGDSVTLTTDGDNDVEYRAVDNIGNVEGWNSVTTIQIDQTVPNVELTWESPDNVDVIFTATCSDATSGMDYVEFYLNDGLTFTAPAAPYEWTVVWSPGLKNAEFKAKAFDMAGNFATDMVTGIEAIPVPQGQTTPTPVTQKTNSL